LNNNNNNRGFGGDGGIEPGARLVSNRRARIIADAQQRVHDARSAFIESASTTGDAAENQLYAAEFHNAVIEYYFALRPLKEAPEVADMWDADNDDAPVLWTEEEHHPVPGDPWRTETIEIRGLESLGDVAMETRTVESTTTGYRGKTETRETVPVRLPPRVLVNVSELLDDCAAKLGFVPEPRERTEDVEGGAI